MTGMRCAGPQAWAWLLPLAAVILNQAVYYGGGWIAQGLYHHDWTLPLDRAVPFLPWTVSVYFLCYLFWAVCYVSAARQKKMFAYRFFCADFLAKAVCLICFLLLPTTNIRPSVEGDGLWEGLVRFLYQVDAPVNLFPSIHCLVWEAVFHEDRTGLQNGPALHRGQKGTHRIDHAGHHHRRVKKIIRSLMNESR
jgi:hypothetical protein